VRVHRASLGGPIAAVAVALAAARCGGEPAGGGAEWAGRVDTLNGVVVVSNPATPTASGPRAWRLEENLRIGVVEGDPDYMFSRIAALEIDGAGRIYVLDEQARRLSIYDATGAFVTAFGREGEGPGEFEYPRRLFWRGGTLTVFDWRLRRFSYFDRAGELLGDERLDIEGSLGTMVFRPDGRLWMQRGPTWWMPMRPETDGVGWLLVIDPRDESEDTILRWKSESSLPLRTERFLTMLPKRFAPSLKWAASTDGTVYVARGSSYEIEVYSPAGELVREFGREFTRHSPSPGERDSAMAWLEGRIERMPQMESRMRRDYEIADPKAATGELIVSDDGYAWVRVYGVDDRVEKQLDIFDPTGRYVATLSVPARLRLERVTRDFVYGVLPDELDVQHVVRYAIRRPGDAAAQRERSRRSGDHGGTREV
jgi:hypothetical protein